MTKKQNRLSETEIKAIMKQDSDFLKPMVQFIVQEVLEAEPTEGR